MGDTKFRQTGRRTAQGPFRLDEKIRKREEGEARNSCWASMSPQQQYDSLCKRRGGSMRQLKLLGKVAR